MQIDSHQHFWIYNKDDYGWIDEDRVKLIVALDAFGTHRLMVGSDWPVCLLSASYGEVMGICLSYISNLSKDEQKRIMGGNACRFYNLS